MIIYKTINLINRKIYVGKDSRNKASYYGSGIVLNYAIKKYGKENFKKETLDTAKNFEELNEKEIFWIKELDACNTNIGYNRAPGGAGGDRSYGFTKETSKKLRIARSKWKLSEKSKNKMSEASKGIPKSKVHIESLKEAWKKRKIEHPHTNKTLEKMRKSMIGKNVGKYVKIYEFKKDNKNYITNEGLVKFAKSKKIHPLNFRELIQGIRNEYHGWTFIKIIKE